ncbi:MAG: TIGR04053 family radical SAM/SPASM domain-containing protein [Myxococcota bacterium]|nr:TIGR04053 family radical SAM/SPASM domain-containing protein [Myxococcota bacterium]
MDDRSTIPTTRRRDLYSEAPFLVFWEMTRACDLVCKHCRACAVPDRDDRELTTAEAKAMLGSIAAMGTPLVVLTGGDPAKRPDLVALVDHGARLGLRMALTPSATPLITRALLAELRDAGLARLAVSLDGLPRSHDAFRGVSGSHARTFEILSIARELGITTQINTSVSRFNQHELPAIARGIATLGIELWSVFFVVPTGRGVDVASLDRDEVERILEWLATVAAERVFDVKTTAAPHFRRVLLQRKFARDGIVGLRDGIGRVTRGINDGQGTMFVSHVGEVYPSGFLPMPCGNVRDSGVADIYRDHPVFQSLRRPDELGGKCGECEFRNVCGGSRARAFATTGDPLAEDPACAYMPRGMRSA